MGVALKHLVFQESCFTKNLLRRHRTVYCECVSTQDNMDVYQSLRAADVDERGESHNLSLFKFYSLAKMSV